MSAIQQLCDESIKRVTSDSNEYSLHDKCCAKSFLGLSMTSGVAHCENMKAFELHGEHVYSTWSEYEVDANTPESQQTERAVKIENVFVRGDIIPNDVSMAPAWAFSSILLEELTPSSSILNNHEILLVMANPVIEIDIEKTTVKELAEAYIDSSCRWYLDYCKNNSGKIRANS